MFLQQLKDTLIKSLKSAADEMGGYKQLDIERQREITILIHIIKSSKLAADLYDKLTDSLSDDIPAGMYRVLFFTQVYKIRHAILDVFKAKKYEYKRLMVQDQQYLLSANTSLKNELVQLKQMYAKGSMGRRLEHCQSKLISSEMAVKKLLAMNESKDNDIEMLAIKRDGLLTENKRLQKYKQAAEVTISKLQNESAQKEQEINELKAKFKLANKSSNNEEEKEDELYNNSSHNSV